MVVTLVGKLHRFLVDSIAQEMEGIKEEREKGVLLLTLGKKEIENYLLDANAITKAVKERLEKRGKSYESYPPIDNEGVNKGYDNKMS